MKREQNSGTFLSAVFVDYDNIYLSLKRKSDEAAKRFAKDAGLWTRAIETGSLITPTNGSDPGGVRRIVMNRCYGNPVPRRNAADNSTDMSSFPFVRHHYLRSGFEIVDCPPLTAQLKNSSDIRMVMDIRDSLTHATYFDEFVILSGDADFTPLLHRLRAHARRTVIYANDYTAAPYTAISDGEVRESDLISLLLEGRIGAQGLIEGVAKAERISAEAARAEILAEVVSAVRSSASPVPLEALADRAIRSIGHEKTVGTGWGGAGGFRELLAHNLPEGLRLSGEPPYVVLDAARHLVAQPASAPLVPQVQHAPQAIAQPEQIDSRYERVPQAQVQPQKIISQPQSNAQREPLVAQRQPQQQAMLTPSAPQGRPQQQEAPLQRSAPQMQQPAQPVAAQQPMAPMARMRQSEPASYPVASGQHAPVPRSPEPQQQQPIQPAAPAGQAPATGIHQSIARIHEACQAPPLAPPEYRVLFEAMAQEINDHGLIGAQTILNIAQRVQERGIDVRRDDVRFVLEVVSEADPWFEQGASANLFAGRFRNFVVARCRSQGLNLSADELDLVEAWFAGTAAAIPAAQIAAPQRPSQPYAEPANARAGAPMENRGVPWSLEDGRQHVAEQRQAMARPPEPSADEFPRIVRTRLRG